MAEDAEDEGCCLDDLRSLSHRSHSKKARTLGSSDQLSLVTSCRRYPSRATRRSSTTFEERPPSEKRFAGSAGSCYK